MKITTTLIIALASLVSNSMAQNNVVDFREKIQFGIKGGANFSNVYDKKGEEFKATAKVGIATAAFVSIPINKYLGVQPEFSFSQKGMKATGKIIGREYALTRKTSYIDIPLLFAFKPSQYVTILAGPQYAYLVQQSDLFTNTTLEQQAEFKNENIRRNIIGIVAGADITIKHLVLGVRVAFDMQNNNADKKLSTPHYKNTLIQTTIGFR